MPDIQNPQITEEVANQAVAQTKQLISSLAERIYSTQRAAGIWEAEENDPDSEDLSGFFLHMHAQISAAHEISLTGGIVEGTDAVASVAEVFIEVAIDMLGAARRFDPKVGAHFIEKVIEQAREAEKNAQEEVADLGEFETEVDGAEGDGDE